MPEVTRTSLENVSIRIEGVTVVVGPGNCLLFKPAMPIVIDSEYTLANAWGASVREMLAPLIGEPGVAYAAP